jgi:arsenite methyltransferase
MDRLNVELTGFYDELPLWSAPFGIKLLEEVPLRKNIRALDIGFGTGFPLLELAQQLGASSVVYGIDPWEEAVE